MATAIAADELLNQYTNFARADVVHFVEDGYDIFKQQCVTTIYVFDWAVWGDFVFT